MFGRAPADVASVPFLSLPHDDDELDFLGRTPLSTSVKDNLGFANTFVMIQPLLTRYLLVLKLLLYMQKVTQYNISLFSNALVRMHVDFLFVDYTQMERPELSHDIPAAKTVRTMMYIYLAVINGWQVRRLEDGDLFEFKPPRSERVRRRRRRSL